MVEGLAERLRLERIKADLSQKEVAERLHISPAAVSFYETGERTPSVEVLVEMAELYHCSADYLLEIKNADQNPKLVDISRLNKKEVEAINTIVNSMENGIRFVSKK